VGTTTSSVSQAGSCPRYIRLHWHSTNLDTCPLDRRTSAKSDVHQPCPLSTPPPCHRPFFLTSSCVHTTAAGMKSKPKPKSPRLRPEQQVEVLRIFEFACRNTWLGLFWTLRLRFYGSGAVASAIKRQTKRNRSLCPGRSEINCQLAAAICLEHFLETQYAILIKHKETNFPGGDAPMLHCVGKSNWKTKSLFSRSSNYAHCTEACAQAHWKTREWGDYCGKFGFPALFSCSWISLGKPAIRISSMAVWER